MSGSDAPVQAFGRAIEAAGGLALEIDFNTDTLTLTGEAAAFGLARVAGEACLRGLLGSVAPSDRTALDALRKDGLADMRVRLLGEDGQVRYVRLRGAGRAGCWTGLILPAGLTPDGAHRRIEHEAALQTALRQGEVVAFHQPIVDLRSGQLAGFEALARWQRPGHGLLGPDDFLPLATEMGLVGQIGDQVRASAVADLSAWRAARPGVRGLYTSANATAGELASPGFADRLIAAVQGAGLPRGAFKLEVNETEVMADPDATLAVLHRIRDAGIPLVLDDFGTGYSSLARLDRFPFDVLKIDQYFVRAMVNDRSAAAIVASVVKLARNFAMLVVAEGVETPAMARAALEHGCDFAQGFLYSGALPPEEAAQVAAAGLAGRFSAPL